MSEYLRDAYIHACVRTLVCARACTNAFMRASVQVFVYAYMRMRAFGSAFVRACIRASMCVTVRGSGSACGRTYMNARARGCVFM